MSLSLTGCDNNPINDYIGNTISRVEKCMEKTSSKLLSEEIVKRSCVEKAQKTFNEDPTNGTARIIDQYVPQLRATFKNESEDKVVTSIDIVFNHTIDYGPNLKENCNKENHDGCDKIIYSKKIKNIWLEPGLSQKFFIDLDKKNLHKLSVIDENFKIIKSNMRGKKSSEEKELPNWSWNTRSEKGLLIK